MALSQQRIETEQETPDASGSGKHPATALPAREKLAGLPHDLAADLRSDHAGETGAVYIYRGILAISRDPAVRAFAEHHLETEQEHLSTFEAVLPQALKTRLRHACALAGWLTGAIPSLFGREAVFATIEAVETFVDEHYQAQIDSLNPREHPELHALLCRFQADEIAHRDDAAERATGTPGGLLSIWTRLVGHGSRAGVWVARRI